MPKSNARNPQPGSPEHVRPAVPRRRRDPRRGSLAAAEFAAADGDYAEALEWLALLEQVGHQLPPEYDVKRRAWKRELAHRTRRGGEGISGAVWHP